VVKNLVDGTYVLHEVAAPNGYEVTTDITFTVQGGQLSGGSEVTSNTVTMNDDFKKTDVNISKANIFSEEIAGATLTLTGTDLTGRTVTFTGEQVTLGTGAELTGTGDKLTFISGSTSTNISGLTDGTYVLHEVAAPNGYEVTTDIEFTIENGKVTGTSVSGNTVTMIDEMSIVLIDTDVEISKKNLLGDELKGATLTLTGKDAEGSDVIFDITNITLGREAKLISTEDGTSLTWVSGSTSTFVNGLGDGTYVLHEVAAPSGYEVTTDITFTIKDGQLSGEVGVQSSSVTMIDDMVLTDVEISKRNTIGEELKGATLTLTGTDLTGREVIFDTEKVTLGKDAELVTDSNGTKLTWVSGSTATMVRGLADGTYVLHEVAAPSGYEVTTDITFIIQNGEVTGVTGVESNSVTMIDDMIVTTTEATTTTTGTTTTTSAETTTTTETTASATTQTAGAANGAATTTTATTATQTAGAATTAAVTTTTTTTTATAKVASATGSNAAPKTGDKGIALTMLFMALAAGGAFAFRKKDEE
ncbi:MAG: NPXTG-anchored protein, partial [Ruminococcus sp.]|nr:NPXTG-anchored protein [Ruminococcus sp.]